jgi:hypothetical protein
LRGQDQLILANLDVDVLAYGEIGLLEPMTFEKDERNLGTRLVTDPVDVGTVLVTSSNLELAAFHANSLCNSHVATEVEVGRVKTAQGTAPAIPCKQVFCSLGHPTIDSEIQAERNRKLAACGFARLVEFSRSADDSTPLRWRADRKRFAICRCSSLHNKPLVPTRNGEAPLPAAQSSAFDRQVLGHRVSCRGA